MRQDDLDNAVPKIARNEMFYFIARGCMIFATVVGMPMAGWMLSRVTGQIDKIEQSQFEQTITLRVLSATLNEKLEGGIKTLSDHELRIRGLERGSQK